VLIPSLLGPSLLGAFASDALATRCRGCSVPVFLGCLGLLHVRTPRARHGERV